MTEQHSFIDSMGNVARGREQMQAGWAAYFMMCPTTRLPSRKPTARARPSSCWASPRNLYPRRQAQAGESLEDPRCLRALVEDGKVAEWRVYADNEPIRERMRKRS